MGYISTDLDRFLDSAPDGLLRRGSRNQNEVSHMVMRVPLISGTGGIPGRTGSPSTVTPFLPSTTNSNVPVRRVDL